MEYRIQRRGPEDISCPREYARLRRGSLDPDGIRTRQAEACFEYGLQKLLDRRLNDAISDRGNSQGSELPWCAWLRDEFATARTRPVGAAPECSVQFPQVSACTLLLANAAYGHPVDTWCALPFVPGHAIPGASQATNICHPVPQFTIRLAGIMLTPLIQLSLHAE